ncbi:cdk-activating kinase assembly factor mat1 [Grosmannia clavigera kw1407]|uniref:Cdk-activating kinase assembly factor mat1 n=1 Tax=Grosmannia clavigera (strain kw1407 / UAMH 11150) TaxID=655863 RepID=F0XN27_GROCL|nr:cdk-activating kinase assembly factor mat1 [Grosmannia clavigera kw1407]EFX00880.1 cdk-activating kinase assembly factor mat1 [Grosmannia clavigera kw1407]
MSRKPSSRPHGNTAVVPAPFTAANSGTAGVTMDSTGTTNGSADDICPVCKTIRYLNKDMVFLINPECYHPMCSNCVGRLFTGPNQCPYAGCHKTLRRKDFRRAFFEDLGVEREVDIRRRVAAVFNQTEDDFESLDAYNEYLEKVEALTMDLVSGTPAGRRTAEAELSRWEAEHRAEIERNRRRGERADELSRSRLAAEKEAARARRVDALRQDEEDRRARLRAHEEDLDSLVRAPDGDGGAAAGRILLRRRGQNQRDALMASEEQTLRNDANETTRNSGALVGSASTNTAAAAAPPSGLTIRGLKDRRKAAAAAAAAAEGPYDPFEGLDPPPSRFHVQETEYRNPWLQGAREHTSHVVGGYDVHEYCTRALFDAFSGLAVFVADEKETRLPGVAAADVASMGASLAAADGPSASSLAIKMEVDAVS